MWGACFFVKAKITKHGEKKNDEDEIGINILKTHFTVYNLAKEKIHIICHY